MGYNTVDVYGSTLGSHLHRGPNQAGNKSLSAYRTDIGVPGYTGYIPAPKAILVTVKGFEHTGRPVDSAFISSNTKATVEPLKATISEYADGYKKLPEDTKQFCKSGGGYWFGERKACEPKPFMASSVYRDQVLNAGETASKQLQCSAGLTCMLSTYEVARQRNAISQPVSPSLRSSLAAATQRPATSVTSEGNAVGYKTTYKAMLVSNPLTGGPAAPGSSAAAASSSAPLEQRYQTMPLAMPPGMFGATPASRMDYGEDGSDPMARSGPGERFQTRLATTRDLAEGTTRNVNHPPGYTGHLPASKFHQLARAHADGADERIDAKQDMLLYSLDQFSRTRVPGATTAKPQAPSNITLSQPAQGPSMATVYGHSNHLATRNGVPPVDNTYYNNSKTGLMSYFHSGGEYISDNGLANAQNFFQHAKPEDGRFKMGRHSKTTSYGAVFKASNSLV